MRATKIQFYTGTKTCRSATIHCIFIKKRWLSTVPHCKKRLAVFSSPAGMSLIIPGQGEFGKWHPGWAREYRLTFFYSAWPKIILRFFNNRIRRIMTRVYDDVTHQIPDEVHALPLVEAVEVVSGRDVWKKIYRLKANATTVLRRACVIFGGESCKCS